MKRVLQPTPTPQKRPTPGPPPPTPNPFPATPRASLRSFPPTPTPPASTSGSAPVESVFGGKDYVQQLAEEDAQRRASILGLGAELGAALSRGPEVGWRPYEDEPDSEDTEEEHGYEGEVEQVAAKETRLYLQTRPEMDEDWDADLWGGGGGGRGID